MIKIMKYSKLKDSPCSNPFSMNYNKNYLKQDNKTKVCLILFISEKQENLKTFPF